MTDRPITLPMVPFDLPPMPPAMTSAASVPATEMPADEALRRERRALRYVARARVPIGFGDIDE